MKKKKFIRKKKLCRPTVPNFFADVSGNKELFFYALCMHIKKNRSWTGFAMFAKKCDVDADCIHLHRIHIYAVSGTPACLNRIFLYHLTQLSTRR